MSRRDELLREMGLGPVWRLRQGPAAPQSAQEEPGGVSAGGATAPSAGAPSADSSSCEERDARISRMDWAELRSAVSGCSACALCRTRKNTVFGVGAENAEWMIVGEAPGAEEDERGEPFVGQAGRLLDNMLASIGLSRKPGTAKPAAVYIANVLKCRPPGNRNPEPAEVACCAPHLARQIALVQPRVIVALGRFAAQTLLDTDASIASLRGRRFRAHGVATVVSYHPAYLLRNLPDKAKAWEDLCFARKVLASV